MSKKLYYIDEKGQKKYYVGKIINDYVVNEKYGLLTVQEKIQKEIELEYHPEEKSVEGWSSYYTYTDENNDEVKYTDSVNNIRKNFDGSYYITKINKSSVSLIHHPCVEAKDAYFSYQDSEGKDQIYEGQAFYDKFTNTYYFYK